MHLKTLLVRISKFLIVTTKTNQVSRKVQEYANDLINLWRELYLYGSPTPNSLDRDYILCDRVFFFLIGLNSDFDVFQTQMFNKEKKPSLEIFIAQTIREENHLRVTTEKIRLIQHLLLGINGQVLILFKVTKKKGIKKIIGVIFVDEKDTPEIDIRNYMENPQYQVIKTL